MFTHWSHDIFIHWKLVYSHIHSLISTHIHSLIIWWVAITVTSIFLQPLKVDFYGYTHWNYTSSVDTYPKHSLSGQELWILWSLASACWLKFTSRTCCQIIDSRPIDQVNETPIHSLLNIMYLLKHGPIHYLLDIVHLLQRCNRYQMTPITTL